ncbi:hypothetical protein AUC69_12210 [Methyloceanibacter superfactus]|uniref:Uncharacterized protein n=1 Tax=Methyloceanibacter superfactus TaxID=1774969 RepID=A0A1E3VV15_9HYPH|nr:hypothetical protein AUC69_12210 [Methyloceanibacter superfactus]
MHHTHQPVHARAIDRVSLKAQEHGRELRHQHIGIGAPKLDVLLDGVERRLRVLGFSGHPGGYPSASMNNSRQRRKMRREFSLSQQSLMYSAIEHS